ncbi:MAG: hypothetical protein ACRDWS_00310 [Acidimicrobiia bacterium]
MYRKILGVFTAVAAALLLVGVAWAGNDAAGSCSIAASAESEPSSSISLATRSTGASLDTQTSVDGAASADVDGAAAADVDANAAADVDAATSTSIQLVDTSSTSTTIESSTGTSVDDNSTSISVDASLLVDAGLLVPITTEPAAYDVGGAGTIVIQVVAGRLVLVDAAANSGWSLEVDQADGRDIKVEFVNGDSDAEFEAKIRDGELRVDVEGA